MSYLRYNALVKNSNVEDTIYKPNDIDNDRINENDRIIDNENLTHDNDRMNENDRTNENDRMNENENLINGDINNDNLDLEAHMTDILLKIHKIIKLLDYNNKNIGILIWFVTFMTLLILNTLIFGFINLKKETATVYLYGLNGAYTFTLYYIMNLILYSIFFLIHLLLISTHLSYTIDTHNFIKYLILNYRQIRYNSIVVKIVFSIALLILVYGNDNDDNANDNTDTTLQIPLYYNLILIETILSMVLILVIHNTIIINKFLSL
jgi:hypothetical protein